MALQLKATETLWLFGFVQAVPSPALSVERAGVGA